MRLRMRLPLEKSEERGVEVQGAGKLVRDEGEGEGKVWEVGVEGERMGKARVLTAE